MGNLFSVEASGCIGVRWTGFPCETLQSAFSRALSIRGGAREDDSPSYTEAAREYPNRPERAEARV